MKAWLKKNQLWFFLGIITLLTTIGTVQSLQLGDRMIGNVGPYKYYNNYLIFKQSAENLIEKSDLYKPYPEKHWDIYKYTPTFSLGFWVFAAWPDSAGLFLWNLVNSLVLALAIWRLPFLKGKFRWWAMGFLILELITSMQNTQSNSLIAGLIIFAFLNLEKNRSINAILLLGIATIIKPFALVGFALFLFYPNLIRNIGWSAIILALLIALPIPFIGWDSFTFQYDSWFNMLQTDHDQSTGISVMGWLQTWFKLDPSKLVVLATGVVLFCLPLFKTGLWRQFAYRVTILASILIWIVIFNHKAESPTFVIAAAGVAIWYFFSARQIQNHILFGFAFVFTVLSATDFFPESIREEWVGPYVLKAVPCILIWGVLTVSLLRGKIGAIDSQTFRLR